MNYIIDIEQEDLDTLKRIVDARRDEGHKEDLGQTIQNVLLKFIFDERSYREDEFSNKE